MSQINCNQSSEVLFDGRELKSESEPSFGFSSQATIKDHSGIHHLDTHQLDNRTQFVQNFKYWNDQTEFMSVNNYDSTYFDRIVEMGTDAVPFIIEELEKGPTPLVHALDLIFPNTVEYDGFVTIKDACKTWLSILK